MDRVFRQVTGAEYAVGHTTAIRDGIDDVRAQVTYLDSLIGPHRNA